jgi:DNA-binding CsgD family transcriptional regulator
MILDGRPLTKRELIELAAFIAEHDLPRLENVPFVQRMLHDDRQRFLAGQETQYIRFPPETIESEKECSRTVSMKAMRSAGCTLQQIGETFDITAERVRQLLHGMPRPKPKSKSRIIRLARAMKRWLGAARYRRCSDCGLWKSDISFYRCTECNRRRARKYYATHREHCLAVTKRLRDKNYRSPPAGRTQKNAQES